MDPSYCVSLSLVSGIN